MISSPFIIELPKLKKVLSKPNVRRLLRALNQADYMNFLILDLAGQVLFGEESWCSDAKTEIEIEGEILGYVLGERPMPEVVALIVYCIRQEMQEKGLANEALSKYEEINFLYDLSKTLMLCRTIPEVAQISMYESRKLISATGGAMLSFNAEKNVLEQTASWGDVPKSAEFTAPNKGILGSIFASGKAEIVNNVPEDVRYIPRQQAIQSLMCAPIPSHQGCLGVIGLFHSRPFFYTANELKLLVMLAEQAGMVLENLMLQEAGPQVHSNAHWQLQQMLVQIQLQLEQLKATSHDEAHDPSTAHKLVKMTEINCSLLQALQQSLGLMHGINELS